MPHKEHETGIEVEAADALWEAIKERAKALKFGSFVVKFTIHNGQLFEGVMKDVEERIRTTNG